MVRKQYTISKAREKWTSEEHARFLEAIARYNRDWRKIVDFIRTRTVAQVRSHAQKHFLKLEKEGKGDEVPPARPKKRSARSGSAQGPSKAARTNAGRRQDTSGNSTSCRSSSKSSSVQLSTEEGGESNAGTSIGPENSALSGSGHGTFTGDAGGFSGQAGHDSADTEAVLGPMTAASTISDDPLPAGHESSSQQPKSAFLPFDVNQMGSDQRLQLLGMMQQLTQTGPGPDVAQASDLGLHARERSSSALEAAAEERLLEQQKQQHQMLLHWHQQQQRQAQWQQRHLQQQEQQWQGWQAAQQAMLGMSHMGHAPAMGTHMGVPTPLQAAGLPYAGPLGINWAFDMPGGHMNMAPTPLGGSLQLPEDIKPPSVLSGNDIGEFGKMGGGDGLFSGGDADSGSGFLSEDLGAAAATLLNF